MDLISIVVPCFNEAEALPFFIKEYEKLKEQMKHVQFELLLINDGSSDDTLKVIKDFSEKIGGGKVHLLLPQLWQGSSTLCGTSACKGRLCSLYGCGPAGSAVAFTGNV